MKKLFFLLTFFFLINNGYAEERFVFLHPIFYQQLSSPDKKSFYVLTPSSKYYEDSEKNISINVPCSLTENQEYNIKMTCHECFDTKCLSFIKINHSFSLSKDQTTAEQYIINHKIFDNQGNINFEETLINDGLITIPPYQ
ncbi:MAG: hypothetical protein IJ830_05935 [Alphaproteobacteria bacterium]|nr:hypothetical protein [Alphaproteobacteria bacterium]